LSDNQHTNYSCPRERSRQFQFFFTFCFWLRSLYGRNGQTGGKTDRQDS